MWTRVDRGGQKPDFFVDVINGWPLAIRENLVFQVICIVQEEGLKNVYLHKYLVDCDEL